MNNFKFLISLFILLNSIQNFANNLDFNVLSNENTFLNDSSKLFKIKNITELDKIYIIETEVNDSIYKIITNKNAKRPLVCTDSIEIGKTYYFVLEKLGYVYPSNYNGTINVYNTEIKVQNGEIFYRTNSLIGLFLTNNIDCYDTAPFIDKKEREIKINKIIAKPLNSFICIGKTESDSIYIIEAEYSSEKFRILTRFSKDNKDYGEKIAEGKSYKMCLKPYNKPYPQYYFSDAVVLVKYYGVSISLERGWEILYTSENLNGLYFKD